MSDLDFLKQYLDAVMTTNKGQVSDKRLIGLKRAGQKDSFKENSRKNVIADWAKPGKKKLRSQALRDGWNKPGAREAKSISAREAANKPEEYARRLKQIHEQAVKQQIAVLTPEGVFASAKEVAEHYQFDRAMVSYKRAKWPLEWFYITQEDYSKCLNDLKHIAKLRRLRNKTQYNVEGKQK